MIKNNEPLPVAFLSDDTDPTVLMTDPNQGKRLSEIDDLYWLNWLERRWPKDDKRISAIRGRIANLI